MLSLHYLELMVKIEKHEAQKYLRVDDCILEQGNNRH